MNKRVVLSRAAVLLLLVTTLAPAGRGIGAANSRFFSETGKTVSDPFGSVRTCGTHSAQ